MTPFERAQAVYLAEPCARPFYEDLFFHLQFGTVISTPDVFAMARPVWRDWPVENLRAPWRADAEGNCWWVWLVAGDMRAALAYMPAGREWIGFERENVPRFRRLDRLMQLTCNKQK
jgi:hypothetical protein